MLSETHTIKLLINLFYFNDIIQLGLIVSLDQKTF